MVMAKVGSSAPPLVAGSAKLGVMREKLCMCFCFFRKYADTKLLHFHNSIAECIANHEF